MKQCLLFLFFICLFIPSYTNAQVWFERIEFNEPGFPTSTTTLVMDTMTSWTQEYDVLNKGAAICTGVNNGFIYTKAGGDAVNDIRVTLTRVTNTGNTWTQIEGDYTTTSSGSWRSDYQVNDQQSAPNDFGYIKVEVELLGDLPTSVCPSLFDVRHTSTNGSSEGYEWTLVSINDNLTPAEEALIANYRNIDYSDLSGSTYFDSTGAVVNPGGATNMPLPNGQTIGEFITGLTDSGAKGGMLRQGLWTIDDFNTTILDGPESATTNPGAGNGVTDDNQTINAVADFGLSTNTPITKITYYFGLTDVAFDTDNDGDTRTNTLPAAGFTWMELGFPNPPSITSTTGNCTDASGTAIIDVLNGSPSFILSGDLSDTSSASPINIVGLTQGTYNFTLTDAKGCMTSDSVIITAACGALPVNLTTFYGQSKLNKNLLFWTTSTEENNSHFEIERSKDGIDFEYTGSVKGNSNSTTPREYSYTDNFPNSDKNFYRLKQVDIDGQFNYSNVIALEHKNDNSNTQIYFSSGKLYGQVYTTLPDIFRVKLYSLSGQVILEEKHPIRSGVNSIRIPITDDYPKGIYLLQYQSTEGGSKTLKVLLD